MESASLMIPLQEYPRNAEVPAKPRERPERLRKAPDVLVVPRFPRETMAAMLRRTGAFMVCRVASVLLTAELETRHGHEHLPDVPEDGIAQWFAQGYNHTDIHTACSLSLIHI